MPLFIGLPYILIEALAFWGVAQWLGTATALILLIAFLFGGLFLAAFEMRSISRRLASGSSSPGRAAGNLGLLAAGAVGVALPGFVTSVFGLLLILPPTRALVRSLLAKGLRKKIEDMGVRSFEATNSYRQHASYGSFSPHSVIDHDQINEEEIHKWSRDIKPEDFGGPSGPNPPRR
ncbi:FxsA family protein [Corynebacterium pseudotuberculosis]|uniref:FxsA family protein n=2 Tax=Corynebacterium pseudotuberculosis TaxID=1719 RepID=D9QAB8_CORP2|nr:FxsA family protein [Corynebacterium pseudotuberculosis]ADL10494.1 FxsA family protein [Corynebacterium pseudotuberculosis C231]ADL20903.1 FxsA family protein [Corynebacterium pseudotuberculosis 1002]ADO26291.2 FxsA family protein [Corynebacterium pseudotuberculosis I19]AEK92352.1 FxsA cytoplasmic membrane protein [Corynebacterium pseudotuberculosis PAT10]AEQ06572.2 FxsA family protein [Corynebacterium pseudotuberculosis CIP 52.97]